MRVIAAAAANTMRAMDAAASPLGIWLAVRFPEVSALAPRGTWILGVAGVAFGVARGRGSGLTRLPTGLTLPSAAKPQGSTALGELASVSAGQCSRVTISVTPLRLPRPT